MAEEIMNFDLPEEKSSIIKVIGVGGGGGNAVNHMHQLGIKDVDFVVCNTDAQALANSPVTLKIQLGSSLTEGRGAGNKPEVGREAAVENLDNISEILSHNTKMIFITAGMGGGTGTGAAPIIAKAAKDMGILTVAIVTIPFRFEGPKRIAQAIDGLNELERYVDSLLVINNERLREICGDLKLSQAFAKADSVLANAAKGIAEIITVPGYVNVDFADVHTVMNNSGVAIMGSGNATGENRAMEAVKEAMSSPLLNNNEIQGAKNILLNITSGTAEISMDEVGQITDYVNNSVSKNALMIWGTGVDATLEDSISVTVIATGFETTSIPELYIRKKQAAKEEARNESHILDDDLGDIFTNSPTTEMHEEEFTISDTSPDQFVVKDKQKDPEEQLYLFGEEENEDKISSINPPSRKRTQTIKSNNFANENVIPLPNEGNIEELENQPAYLRKNIKLNEEAESSEENVSRFSLDDEEKESKKGKDKFARLRSGNSFLHDQVD